eukprot:6587318-Ditylum_brightwellii.AAC.1
MYWWFIRCIWDGENARLATKEEMPLDLTTTIGCNALPTTIKQQNCYESFEQLEVWSNAAGDMTDELKDNVDNS